MIGGREPEGPQWDNVAFSVDGGEPGCHEAVEGEEGTGGLAEIGRGAGTGSTGFQVREGSCGSETVTFSA